MKLTDLRIGNLVYAPSMVEKTPIKIAVEHFQNIAEIATFSPIPIDDEWIEQLGWENSETIYEGYSEVVASKRYKYGKYMILWNYFIKDERYTLWSTEPFRHKEEETCLKTIDYVHQLQNLYYFLEGKELKLKELA